MPKALPFTPVLRDPVLRVTALLMVLWGAVVCSFGPYTSVLAVETFGLGDSGFVAILVVSSVLSVTAALWVGIRTDQTGNRRGLSVATQGVLLVALVLMALVPNAPIFVLAHGILIPLASSMWGQLFALARLAASVRPAEERDGILATMRALFALPFILVLPLWSVAFQQGADMLSVYPVCLVLACVMLALTLARWPQDGRTAWLDAPSGLSFRAALAELTHPPVALRIAALGAVNGAASVYVAILGLVMVESVGRGPADVALYFGIVAGLEVPFMLALPLITHMARRTVLILAGTTLYCLHLALLPLLAGSWTVWLLVLPAGVGGAAMLTLPIAYLQDMLATRPGTGASLMALQVLAGQIIAAVCFGIGTAVAGYGLVALLSAATAIAGAVWLHWADGTARLDEKAHST